MRKKGFTLIELLVVIAIIGVLASIVLASLNTARRKSRDARRITDVKQIQLGLELYFDGQNSNYPTASATCDATTTYGLQQLSSNNYMPSIPRDPLSSGSTRCYAYSVEAVGGANTGYHLGAILEDTDNPALDSDKDQAVGKYLSSGTDFTGLSTDSTVCNTTASGAEKCYDLVP